MLNHTTHAQGEAVEAGARPYPSDPALAGRAERGTFGRGGDLRPSASWYGSALIAVMILVTFSPVLRNGFVEWDDGLLITENPIVRGVTWGNVKAAFTQYDPELYIPLTYLSYQADYAVWGMHPFGFHLTNLVLHTMNAVLVFWLVMLLGIPSPSGGRNSPTPSPFPLPRGEGNGGHYLVAFVVALLWAVHPLNVEAVAWASARKDLLSGFFFLLSVCAYIKYRGCFVTLRCEHSEPRRATWCHGSWLGSGLAPHHDTWYWSSLVAFLFGLLAKVSIAPLPLVLLLLERFLPHHPLPFKGEGQPTPRLWPASRVRVLKRISPFFLLSVVFGVVALGGKHGNAELFSEKILIGAKAAAFYIGKLAWPTGFSVLYPYTQPITWSNPDLLLPVALLLSLSVLAFFFRRKSPPAALGWAFFLLMLAPSITNFAKGHDVLRDVYFASDRYAYLASIAPIALTVGALCWLCKARNSLSLGFFGLLCFFGFLSSRQSFVWKNTETLFQNAVERYPNSHVAWNNLGSIALARGDAKTALEDYDHSLAIRPNAAAFFNLGNIAMEQGLTNKAMELYRHAIRSRPIDQDAYVNLGVLLLREGQVPEAIEAFRKAIAIDDTFVTAHFNLGLALEATGDRAGARGAYERALKLDPSDQEARGKLAQ